MFASVIHATMRFFNVNTSGRILNRFSKDLGAVDELLPNCFVDTVQVTKYQALNVHPLNVALISQLLLNLVGAIVVVACIEPYLLIPTTIMFISFYFLRNIYLSTSRNVKRLEGISKFDLGKWYQLIIRNPYYYLIRNVN